MTNQSNTSRGRLTEADPCLGLYHRPNEKSHRSYVYNDGRQHYCQRCGEKIDHATFSNIPADYVVTHDLGDYNIAGRAALQEQTP